MNSFLNSIGYNGWILPALLIVPVLGALAIWVHGGTRTLPKEDEVASGAVNTPRAIALWTFVAEFVISLGLWWSFNPGDSGWQAVVDWAWIPSWGIRFTLGVDGIAVMMVLLTTFIMVL